MTGGVAGRQGCGRKKGVAGGVAGRQVWQRVWQEDHVLVASHKPLGLSVQCLIADGSPKENMWTTEVSLWASQLHGLILTERQ